MKRRIPLNLRTPWLLLALPFLLAFLSSCYETSYDKAVAKLDNGPPPPPPPPPPPGGFGPNFSEIQANVFTPSCATSNCHAGAVLGAGLDLTAASSYAMLVGVASTQSAGVQRVNPGNPNNSYLVQKLEGPGATGNRMPPSGALAQASITTIRQWITDGAIDDRVPANTPIRVTSLSIVPGSTLTTSPNQITAGFDRDLDASTVNLNTFILQRSNNDGVFGDGDDITITAASITVPGANPRSAVFALNGTLADDTYRIRLLGSGASIIMDQAANALDGEFSGTFPSGNGVAGGDFAAQFTMMAPVVLGPTLDQIQAVIFTPSCATAGCHSAGSQAAGLSLNDADTSFLELVGQFSNQNGQANVMLVAPNDPNASYLIRKMENTAGITGGRMPPPPAAAIPQADINQVRTWISNGALR